MNRLGAMANASLHLVYSYSHKDERMLNRLRTHLAVLRRHEGMTEWYDRDIEAGAKIRSVVEERARSRELSEEPKRSEGPAPADARVKPSAAMREQEVLAALAELVKLHALPHHTQRQDDFVIVLGSRDPNYYSQCFFQDEPFLCAPDSTYHLAPQ